MKKINHFFGFAAVVLAIMASSCKTPENITYFQDMAPGRTFEIKDVNDIRVQPDDKLSILVNTQDPNLSSLFNLVKSQTRLTGGNPNVYSIDNSDYGTSLYTVDEAGDINFPVLGKLHIEGMRRSEVAKYIESKLISEDLVKEPVVTVEFANTCISVLGEIAKPGRYNFNKERLTVLDAIAMAGDLKPNGERENVMVVREENGAETAYYMNLTDMAELVSSPAYYLQQNDIVYVEPNVKAKRETTSAGNASYTPSFWISIASIGMTATSLIVTLTK